MVCNPSSIQTGLMRFSSSKRASTSSPDSPVSGGNGKCHHLGMVDRFRIHTPQFFYGHRRYRYRPESRIYFPSFVFFATRFFASSICSVTDSQGPPAHSPPPPAEQKMHPRVSRLPSRLGQVKPRLKRFYRLWNQRFVAGTCLVFTWVLSVQSL